MKNRGGLAWLLIFLLALAAEGAYCFQHPVAYFDTLAYVSLAHGVHDGNDFAAAGKHCAEAVPGAYAGCGAVLSSEVFAQASGLAPFDYEKFLRFYTVKPLYNGVIALLTRGFGMDPYRALRCVSTLSFTMIGVLCVLWLRRLVTPGLASAGALCLVSLPGVIGLGRGLLPDAAQAALLLLGAYLLTMRRAWWAGAMALAAATLIRPDALVFVAIYGAVLVWRNAVLAQRRMWLVLFLFCAGCWYLLLAAVTHALPWRVLFVHSFLAWTAPADYSTLHLSVREYLRVLASNGVRTVLFCLPLPALLAVIALGGKGLREMRDLVWAGAAAVALRVLLYPGVEERYYIWIVLLAGIGALAGGFRTNAEA